MAALSDVARQLLHVLLGQCPKRNPAHLAPISRERMAEKIGRSVATVDRALRELVTATLIKRPPQYEAGERRRGRPHPVVPTVLTELALQLVGLSPVTAVSTSPSETQSLQRQAEAPVDKKPQEPAPAAPLDEAQTSAPLQPLEMPAANQDQAQRITPEEARTPAPLRPLLAVMSGPQVWHLTGLASRAGVRLEDILQRMHSAVLAARRPFGYLRRLILCGRTWNSPTLPERQKAAAVERQAARAAAEDAVTGFLASHAGHWLASVDSSVVLQVVGFTCEEHRHDGRHWQSRLLNPATDVPRVIAALEAGRLRAIEHAAAAALLSSAAAVRAMLAE